MGIFILHTGPERPEAEAAAEHALVAGGFHLDRRLAVDGARLTLLRKLNGDPVAFLPMGQGDFACYVGTLLHGATTGTQALKTLYDDFGKSTDPWKDTAGHWCLLIRKAGVLYVLSDRLTVAKIYQTAEAKVLSNSFIALCELGGGNGLDSQAAYEYVWNGTTFGTRTLFHGIDALPNNTVAEIAHQRVHLRQHSWSPSFSLQPSSVSLDEAAQDCANRLEQLFRKYARLWPGQVRSALSGGYDSRLLLAAMNRTGMTPRLFVYGGDDCVDVRVAKEICRGEGLVIDHVHKALPVPDPDEDFAGSVAADVIAFDGWRFDGLFDGGVDRADRLARSDSGQVLMNGSVGEVFRNFFYLRDRRYSLRDVVWTFYSRYDPAACTAKFRRSRYEDVLIAEMAQAIGVSVDARLERGQVEMIYPLFRGRYWSARDAAINQRFGTTLYPFLEPQVFDGTWNIPIRLKNFGRLEARMIALLSPSLAGYTSAYGYDFAHPMPWGNRLQITLDYWRLPAMRRLSYRVGARLRPATIPHLLRPECLQKVFDQSFPYMRKLFHVGRLRDADALNRLCTVEYLCQRYAVG